MKATLLNDKFCLAVRNNIELNEIKSRFMVDRKEYIKNEPRFNVDVPVFNGNNFDSDAMIYSRVNNSGTPFPLNFIFDVTDDDAALEVWYRLASHLGGISVPADKNNPDDYTINHEGISTLFSLADSGICGISCALSQLKKSLSN